MIIVTMCGNKSGKVRNIGLMRVAENADYETKTDREIPVFVARRKG